MLRPGFLLLSVVAMLACSKKTLAAGEASSVPKRGLPERGSVEPAAAGPDVVKDAAPATATSHGVPLVPLAKGETLRIKGLETVPLEVTVPPRYKLRMEGPGEDIGPEGHLEGPDYVDIVISQPGEEGFFPLSEQRKALGKAYPGVSIIRGEELAHGFVVIYEGRDSESRAEFGAIASRPDLGVRCAAMFLHRLSEAERCAAVCLSLRAAKRPTLALSSLPPLSPLAEGKPVRIKGLKTQPLAMTVPPKFKLRLGPSVGPEGPDANFEGPKDLKIVVHPPREGRFPTLSEQREELTKNHPSVTVVRADETPEGFLVIALGASGVGDERYDVVLSRPGLNVLCRAYTGGDKLSDAELLASACLSLRAASDGTP
jgi:hypothetical protein